MKKTTFTLLAALLLSATGVKAQNALEFPDANDYGTVPNDPTFQIAYMFTIEAWIKVNGSGYQTVIATDDVSGTGHTGYWFGVTPSGTAGIQLFDGDFSWTTISGTTNVNDGNWHHIAASCDNTTISIVVDGVFEGSGDYYEPLYEDNDLDVGTDQEGNSISGTIDDVRIWWKTRSVEDINTYKDSCLTGMEDSLGVYYKFEETEGSSFSDSGPYGVNGTLTNMTDDNWVDGKLCPADVSGIEDEVLEDVFVFYNDAENMVSVDFKNETAANITVYSMNGTIVHQEQNINDSYYSFDLNALAGMYIVTVESMGQNRHFKIFKSN